MPVPSGCPTAVATFADTPRNQLHSSQQPAATTTGRIFKETQGLLTQGSLLLPCAPSAFSSTGCLSQPIEPSLTPVQPHWLGPYHPPLQGISDRPPSLDVVRNLLGAPQATREGQPKAPSFATPGSSSERAIIGGKPQRALNSVALLRGSGRPLILELKHSLNVVQQTAATAGEEPQSQGAAEGLMAGPALFNNKLKKRIGASTVAELKKRLLLMPQVEDIVEAAVIPEDSAFNHQESEERPTYVSSEHYVFGAAPVRLRAACDGVEVLAKMYFHMKKLAWRAELLINGTKRQRSFSCKLYGYERARLMCEWARNFVMRTATLPGDDDTRDALTVLMDFKLPSDNDGSAVPDLVDWLVTFPPKAPKLVYRMLSEEETAAFKRQKKLERSAAKKEHQPDAEWPLTSGADGGREGQRTDREMNSQPHAADATLLQESEETREDKRTVVSAPELVVNLDSPQTMESEAKTEASAGGELLAAPTTATAVAGQACADCEAGGYADVLCEEATGNSGCCSSSSRFLQAGSDQEAIAAQALVHSEGHPSAPSQATIGGEDPVSSDALWKKVFPELALLPVLVAAQMRRKRRRVGKKPHSGVRGMYFQQGAWKINYFGEFGEMSKLFPYTHGNAKEMKQQHMLARLFLKHVIEKNRQIHESDGEGLSDEEPGKLPRLPFR
ncbi:hypothetical protein cyc_00592 [Cyclospora cayetanensis]|uniref:Uncharacterized protein n=1 Tax=Cyclospora cayetanensis TaxID=88456 RepID=A0A1D3CYR2_9EIME|nr:hypothetical protein cyc_00592 [Cyclospora cayetanensis]